LQAEDFFIFRRFLTSRSYLACQNAFVLESPYYPGGLDKSTRFCSIKHFHDTGSVNDKNRSCRPAVLSEVENIGESLLLLRKFAQQSGLPYASLHAAMKIFDV
jgi:hypothetical protein